MQRVKEEVAILLAHHCYYIHVKRWKTISSDIIIKTYKCTSRWARIHLHIRTYSNEAKKSQTIHNFYNHMKRTLNRLSWLIHFKWKMWSDLIFEKKQKLPRCFSAWARYTSTATMNCYPDICTCSIPVCYCPYTILISETPIIGPTIKPTPE